MKFNKILITGGAGFVGSALATMLKNDFPGVEVICIDNLMRHGSEFHAKTLVNQGLKFIHGDIRRMEDLEVAGEFDLLIDCAAEPSVHAGVGGSPRKVMEINLAGSINCFELARRHHAGVLFISTSRVYPIHLLRSIACREADTRLVIESDQHIAGVTADGISEDFPLAGARSFYGATKLACELMLQEYVANYDMPAIINRCGVLAGAGQMGRADQGVVTLWVARHIYNRSLKYTGFGGLGKQVRDVLCVSDLYKLILKQMTDASKWDGRVYNVGGGLACSASLCELTALCRRATGINVEVSADTTTASVDIPVYVTDNKKVSMDYAWKPQVSVEMLVDQITRWINTNKAELAVYLN